MHKSQKRALFISVAVVIVLLVGVYLFFTFTSATVSATGQSTLKVQPDEVSVIIQLQAHNQTAQAAKDSLTTLSNQASVALKNIGLNDSQIQTSSYSIYPDYSYVNGQRKLKGYIAQQTLTVVTGNFTFVPSIVDSSVNAGGTVSTINFQLSSAKQNEYKAKALEQASADARTKAAATAAGLGKSLGGLVSVQNQEFHYGPVVYYAQAGAETGVAGTTDVKRAAMHLTPTDIDVQGTVAVTYRIGFF